MSRWCLLLTSLACVACADDGPAGPDPKAVVSVTVSATRDTLTFIADSVQFTASARNHADAALPEVTIAWQSSDTSIATVSATGVVRARRNGSATITALAGLINGARPVTVRQRGDSLLLAVGTERSGEAGAPADSALAMRVFDAAGQPARGIAVTFAVTSGGGSVVPTNVITDSTGMAVTTWTLGGATGLQTARATFPGTFVDTVFFTATTFAALPDTMYAVTATNHQSELPGYALPQPVGVQVVDRFGNPVPDVPLTFAIGTGGGTIDTTESRTDLDGIAWVSWTLGAALGAQTVVVTLPDSAVGAIVDMPGSPVTITASAVPLTISATEHAVVGDTVLIHGLGFSLDSAQNTVYVDNLAAPVVSVTQTQIRAIVPSFGCVAQTDREIFVFRDTHDAFATVKVAPARRALLAVGQRAVYDDPDAFCLQVPASATGNEQYVVGLTATRASNADVSFMMVASTWDLTSLLPAPTIMAPRVAPTNSPGQRYRAWREDFFATPRHRQFANAESWRESPSTASAIGDQVAIRLPKIDEDACNLFTDTTGTLVATAAGFEVVTTVALPTGVDAALASLLAAIADSAGPALTAALGAPSDLDGNDAITIVLTTEGAFSPPHTIVSSLGDLVSQAACPASNEMEIVYVAVPASALASASAFSDHMATRIQGIVRTSAQLIVESRRLESGQPLLAAWLADAVTDVAMELIGRSLNGHPGRDDRDAIGSNPESLRYYHAQFESLARYFGWNGAVSKVPNAPDRCSVYGFGAAPCTEGFERGAAWAFLRFLLDRLPAGGADPDALQQLLAAANTSDGTATLETLMATTLDTLLLDFAATIAVDGMVTAAQAPALQFPSWNLSTIYAAMPAERRLAMPAYGMQRFTATRTVVGGSTAYTRINGGGAAHDGIAIRIVNDADASIDPSLRPRLWIVRVQ